MTIEITIANPDTMYVTKIEDGHAYIDPDDRVFVGNRVDDIVAFSMCGTTYIGYDDRVLDFKLVEVDLHVNVRRK